MINAECHLLGSWTGYTTIDQSPGIDPAEKSALESPVFGQSDDRSYRDSLAVSPAALGRVLPTGRYAVSRCLAGPPDSVGRSTLIFASLVFGPDDWLSFASERLLGLLNDERPWLAVRMRRSQPVTFNHDEYQPTLFATDSALAALDAWLTERHDPRALVVLPDNFDGAAVVTGLPRLIPRRERAVYNWGLRVLSPGAPVQIATLACPPDARRRTIRPHPQQGLSHAYSQALLNFWQRDRKFPAAFVNGLQSATFPAGLTFSSDSPPPTPGQGKAGWKAAPGLMLAAGGIIGSAVLGLSGWALLRNRSVDQATPTTTEQSNGNTPSANDPITDGGPAGSSVATAHERELADRTDLLARLWNQRAAWDRQGLSTFITEAESLYAARNAGRRPFAHQPPWEQAGRDQPAGVPEETDPLGEQFRGASLTRDWIITASRVLSTLEPPRRAESTASISSSVELADRLLRDAPRKIAEDEVERVERRLSDAIVSLLPRHPPGPTAPAQAVTTQQPEAQGQGVAPKDGPGDEGGIKP